jgi:hypothetical protein
VLSLGHGLELAAWRSLVNAKEDPAQRVVIEIHFFVDHRPGDFEELIRGSEESDRCGTVGVVDNGAEDMREAREGKRRWADSGLMGRQRANTGVGVERWGCAQRRTIVMRGVRRRVDDVEGVSVSGC